MLGPLAAPHPPWSSTPGASSLSLVRPYLHTLGGKSSFFTTQSTQICLIAPPFLTLRGLWERVAWPLTLSLSIFLSLLCGVFRSCPSLPLLGSTDAEAPKLCSRGLYCIQAGLERGWWGDKWRERGGKSQNMFSGAPVVCFKKAIRAGSLSLSLQLRTCKLPSTD